MAAGGDSRLVGDRASGGAALWALASGKGGVGKSLLAANLGCLLAESDWPTTVVDLDLQAANLHTFLGVDGRCPGLEQLFTDESPLEALVRCHEVPGLSFVRGHQAGLAHTSGRLRRRLLGELRRLPSSAVVLDLGTGTGPDVLDYFVAADVPLLVVTPEPASIENAYRLLRAIYVRRLRQLARREDLAAKVEGILVRAASEWHPGELRAQVAAEVPSLIPQLDAFGGRLRPRLVLNQVRHDQDMGVGFGLVAAVRQYFGIPITFSGAIAHDPRAWVGLRRRKLIRREEPDEILSEGLARLADNIIEGGELRPGEAMAIPSQLWGAAVQDSGPSARCV